MSSVPSVGPICSGNSHPIQSDRECEICFLVILVDGVLLAKVVQKVKVTHFFCYGVKAGNQIRITGLIDGCSPI